MITRPERLLAYESDALTTIRGTPLAVAFPSDRSELIEVVRVLYRRGTPFVPRGAGTGLAGGAVVGLATTHDKPLERTIEVAQRNAG